MFQKTIGHMPSPLRYISSTGSQLLSYLCSLHFRSYLERHQTMRSYGSDHTLEISLKIRSIRCLHRLLSHTECLLMPWTILWSHLYLTPCPISWTYLPLHASILLSPHLQSLNYNCMLYHYQRRKYPRAQAFTVRYSHHQPSRRQPLRHPMYYLPISPSPSLISEPTAPNENGTQPTTQQHLNTTKNEVQTNNT